MAVDMLRGPGYGSPQDLFFGHCCGPMPVGLFKVTMPPDRKRPNAHLPMRMWG